MPIFTASARRFAPLAATTAAAMLVGYLASGGQAEGLPADKVAFSGSTVEVVGPQAAVTVLSKTFKTSTPADLILQLTSECALTTNLTTTGNDTAQAVASVRMWLEIDGVAVPVATGDTDGRVVFCNRLYRRDTSNFDDQDATIRTFLITREANAFNWLALNLGNGTHTVNVKAELAQSTVGDATALAAIGKRSLVVEPAHLPVDATRDST